MHRCVIAATGAAATAVLLLLLWHWTQAATSAAEPAGRGATEVVPAAAPIGPPPTDVDADPPTLRENMPAAPARPVAGTWSVRLLGIDPSVPWTTPLRFTFERRFEAEGHVDADGVCHFLPPPPARLTGVLVVHVFAADPNYRIDRPHQLTAGLQQTGTMELLVYPVARLAGRVLGPDGPAIAARVRAFAIDAEGPHKPLLARTDSGPDGSYVLRVPPATPLLLLADVATIEAAPPWQQATTPPLVLPAFDNDLNENPWLLDPRLARADLVPASLRAEGVHAAVRTLPDLRLGATAPLTGRATFADGRPLANVAVVARPTWATTPAWLDDMHWSANQGIAVGANTRTDARGEFTLRLAVGNPFTVAIAAGAALRLDGEPSVTASAPGFVELQATGELVTVMVTADGTPVPRAWIDVDDSTCHSDGSGRAQVTLGPRSVRIRAHDGWRTSPWVTLPPGARPPTVALELAAADLAEVRFALRCQPPVLDALFTWRSLPSGFVRTTTAHRQRGDEPFVVLAPAGSYRLTVAEPLDAPGGDYLLPLQLDIDVPGSGFAIACDGSYGGKLAIEVLDANGTRVPATFSLHAADGRDVTAPTVAFDLGVATAAAAGVLQSLSGNRLAQNLAPGDYSLAVEVAGRGSWQQAVSVRARVTTTVQGQVR